MNLLTSRSAILICFILIFANFAFSQKAQNQISNVKMQEALSLLDKRDYGRAIDILKGLTKVAPQNGDALNALGIAYLGNGETKESESVLKKAIKLDPNNTAYKVNLAHAFLLGGKTESTIRESDEVIALQPKNQVAYNIKGNAFLWLSKSEEAIANAEKAIEIEPTYTSAYILKADALMQIFTRKMSELQPLKDAIETLDACAVKCDKKSDISVLSEKGDALKAFHNYFTSRRTLESKVPDARTNITPIKLLSQPIPPYTEEGRRNGLSGTVVLAAFFSADGERVQYVLPVRGLGYGLTQQAILAARRIKFEPQKIDGKPVSVVKLLQYTFNIR